MKWNGTVSQVGRSAIATRFATANPTQARSIHSRYSSGQAQRSARIDAVPLAPDRADGVGAELGPQPADVHVDHVGARVEVVVPHRRQQALLGDGLAGLTHQLGSEERRVG